MLMTKALAKALPPLRSQDGKGDEAIVYASYFSIFSQWRWGVLEYDPATGEAFGLVIGQETELGYFSVPELQDVTQRGCPAIERDRYFDPCTLGEWKSAHHLMI